MPSYKDQPCVDCGKVVNKRVRSDRPVRCIHCAITKSVKHNVEMHNKNGLAYNRWLAGMNAYMAKANREQGEWRDLVERAADPSPDGDPPPP